jgi:uncharacterized membrane protein
MSRPQGIGGISNALEKDGPKAAALRGASLGAFAYATYDLTNQATLAVWPVHVSLADIAWGTFASATASAVGALVWSRAARRAA